MNSKEVPPYLDKLNDSQKEAVMCTKGPVMIIAGAGSGKTRVLTYRIAHLLKQGEDAFSILSLTFTNKAAKEMKERIESVVGREARNLWMGTFHSVFAKILRVEAERLGYTSNFTIYDTDDSKNLLKSIIKEGGLDDKTYKPSLVYNRISMSKNNLIDAKDYVTYPELTEQDAMAGRPKMSEIFKVYSERCFKADAMDFDDLLLNTYKLLRSHADVLHKYQHKFKYIMVDEYQDTNLCQYMIVKRLAAMHQNICVVGDDSQSIYSFRGANIKNILNFEKDYPDLNVFKLEKNYRSTQTIVNASGDIIKNNKEKLDKTIWTDNDEGEKIRVLRSLTDNEEGKLVAQSIFQEQMANSLLPSSFAILYRTNSQSRAFEEALRKQGIPYRVYGGLSFYQRKEVKDMVAYLRLIINPNDEEALKRIINYPARKIGKTTVDRLIVLADTNNCSLFKIVEHANSFRELGSSIAPLNDFALMIKSFATLAKTRNAYEVAEIVARQTNLIKTLAEDKTPEGVSRFENLAELLNSIKEFCEDDTSEKEKTLPVFLQEIALLTDMDNDKDQNPDKVTLMTVHSSKGLEFPVVFVVGLEENLFPSQMALNSRQELEEERRLFYVALTRAEKKAYLSFATSRFRWGNLTPCEPSRFIEEISPQYLDITYSSSFTKPGDNALYGIGFGPKVGLPGTRFSPKPTFKSQTTSYVPSSDFSPDDPFLAQPGKKIEHQRFGFGTVRALEDSGDNAKAVIDFEEYGEKKIVLRFAKIRFV